MTFTIPRGRGASVRVSVNPNRRQSMATKKRRKLHGAALWAHLHKRAKSRRNPMTRKSFDRAQAAWIARRSGGKHLTKRQRAGLAGAYTRMVGAGVRKTKHSKTRYGTDAATMKLVERLATARKRKAAKKAPATSHKTVQHKAAAKTAKKGGKSMTEHQKRVAAGKKAARTRKRNLAAKAAKRGASHRKHSGGKKRRAPRRIKLTTWQRRYAKARKSRKPRRRILRQLRSARITILRVKAGKVRKHRKQARRYVGRFRMRANPFKAGAIKSTIVQVGKFVLPLGVALVGARLASSFIAQKLNEQSSIPAVVQTHAPVLASLGIVLGAHFLTAKVKPLAKFRLPILAGAGLAMLATAVKQYAGQYLPANVAAALGGDDSVYGALPAGDYIDASSDPNAVGDYIDTDEDPAAVGDYVDTTDADYEELSGYSPVRALTGRQAVPVRRIGGGEPLASYYSGIFAGGYIG